MVLLFVACVVLSVLLFFAYQVEPLPIAHQYDIQTCAEEFGLPKHLVAAVIFAESSFRESVVSPKGAVGLMQIMPSTAIWFAGKIGYPLRDVDQLKQAQTNVYLGCAYLDYLFEKFQHEKTVLAAYNAGEGTVANWLKNPIYSLDNKTLDLIPYSETANYVKKIEAVKNEYSKEYYWKL